MVGKGAEAPFHMMDGNIKINSLFLFAWNATALRLAPLKGRYTEGP